MAPAHPTGKQHVPREFLDAAHQVLMQVLHHALKVPVCQDNHLQELVLQPRSGLCEGVLGGAGGEGPCSETQGCGWGLTPAQPLYRRVG